ncbi:MAG TPA: PilZ domain-containing protein, partial [Bdellovibrio sp.]|nr:PilZ domain-containing protein [Bdellovibrio sp.]
FIEIYLYRFGEERMAKVLEARPINFNKRQYRVPIKLRASFLANGQYYICWILDITSRGCFIAVPKEITLENHTEVEISFRLGVRSYQIPSRIAWFNSDVSLRHEHGYGVQFNRVDAEIEREINSWGSSRNEQKVYKR